MSNGSSIKRGQDRLEVFLAHGWDEKAIKKVKQVLRDVGVEVAEWDDLVARIGKTSPQILEVVKGALRRGMVFVVLFTPDHTVTISEHLRSLSSGSPDERRPAFQPRPNVLIEAGMALAVKEKRTVVIEVGEHSQISDLAGLHVVRTDKTGWAETLARKLATAFGNAKRDLELDEAVLGKLRRKRPISYRSEPRSKRASRKAPTKQVVEQVTQCDFAADPVRRRERLLAVFREYGGPTSARWRFDTKAPDCKVMKEAEAEDKRNPLKEGSRVYVQQHYESEYNGKIGAVKRYSPEEHFCSVEFPPETGLARKTFHVMYLSRCK